MASSNLAVLTWKLGSLGIRCGRGSESRWMRLLPVRSPHGRPARCLPAIYNSGTDGRVKAETCAAYPALADLSSLMLANTHSFTQTNTLIDTGTHTDVRSHSYANTLIHRHSYIAYPCTHTIKVTHKKVCPHNCTIMPPSLFKQQLANTDVWVQSHTH